MENHPIPQDVTGFQFKLIGNMTVKQFGYLAFGMVFAVICYYAPLFVLLKFPLVVLFASSGICLAFVPLEGRPLDQMLSNFIKALVVPNQFVFHKSGGHLLMETTPPQPVFALPTFLPKEKTAKKVDKKATAQEKAEELEYYIHHLPKKIQNSLDEKERMMLQSLPIQTSQSQGLQATSATSIAKDFPSQPQLMGTPQLPTPSPLSNEKPDELQSDKPKQPPLSQAQVIQIPPEMQIKSPTIILPDRSDASAEEIEKEVEKARQQLGLPNEDKLQQEQKPQGVTPVVPAEPIQNIQQPLPAQEHEKAKELEGQLHDIAMQKQQLEDELLSLKKQLSQQAEKKPGEAYTPQATEKKDEIQHVRKISADMARSVGLPNVPDVPNLVTGIVKDPRGNVLPHILVEIKDKDGNPVRAFKTNTLGQFASATPLNNGVFTIEFEDSKGQHTFDIIELTVNGKVILPIEVISHDAREELRKALFN